VSTVQYVICEYEHSNYAYTRVELREEEERDVNVLVRKIM